MSTKEILLVYQLLIIVILKQSSKLQIENCHGLKVFMCSNELFVFLNSKIFVLCSFFQAIPEQILWVPQRQLQFICPERHFEENAEIFWAA